MLETPRILELAARPLALLRLTVPRSRIRQVMGPARSELLETVAAQGVATTGPWLTHHLRMDPEVFDFAIGVPVAAPVAEAGRVVPGEWPAMTAARAVYRGPFEGLGPAWGELGAWIDAEGRRAAPDLWECYLSGPETDPDPASWRTELTRPLLR